MILKKWDDLPEFMKCDEVKVYYDILSRKKGSLVLKRIFDIVVGVILLILLAIPMLVIDDKNGFKRACFLSPGACDQIRQEI